VSSLDKIMQEDAEYLISGHARPIIGKENVRRTLTGYRDAIDYVLVETLKGMNDGLSPGELAHTIKLPDPLANKDDLREFYGVVEWSVRAIYSGYLGWFDGNPTNLFPLSPAEEAKRMVELIGSEKRLIKEAEKALASEDFQWACQLADFALELDPGSSEVKRLKAEALFALADRQISSNARHYYLSVAKELSAE
jgi:alkyl sulfatase BDS1-like metallo-beta-lactamase superfamily hydrolase